MSNSKVPLVLQNPVMGWLLVGAVVLACILLCLLSSGVIAVDTGVEHSPPMRTLNAMQSGYSIAYPSRWTALETPSGNHGDEEVVGIISHLELSFPAVTIARREFLNAPLDDVVNWGEDRIQDVHPFATYQPISTKELSNSKYDGILHEYYLRDPTLIGTVTRHCVDWYAIDQGAGYALTFCAHDAGWEKVSDIYQEMIQSFVIHGQ
jgi:hypothetical protein